MSWLALYLLGPPRLELDGEGIHIPRRKALALLAYLAVTGRSHSRDSLATLLWPELDQSTARARLRRALAALREAIGDGWLEADRETVGLNPDAEIWLDVDRFHDRLAACKTQAHPPAEACPDCLPLLEEAVELYRDHFLAGFTLRDSAAFDEWQFFQTEGLKDELAGALQRLARYHSDQGEYELAIEYARRWLALDPLHEPAHRHLMMLYAHAGQQAAALRQYRLCLRTLEEELGLLPSAETTALYGRIRAERARPAEPRATIPGPPSPDAALPSFLRPAQDAILAEEEAPTTVERPVFVARERELARLDGYLEAALTGQGQVVFITGGPGRGKTALMHEFTRRAMEAHPDLLVAHGNCNAYSGIGDPYLPFREVLGMLTGDVESHWVAGTITREHAQRLWATLPTTAQALLDYGPFLIDTVLPGPALLGRARAAAPDHPTWLGQLQAWVERDRAGHSDLEQSAFFEQFANVLRRLAQAHPLVVTLDDVQWADTGSVSLLFHLGRRIADAGERLLIVGAYRPEEISSDRDGKRHPLEKTLAEFKRRFGDVYVDLTQADEMGGRHFVDALLDSEANRLGQGFRSRLLRHTGGHPLFTVELLRAMQERGELAQDAQGRWVAGPALDWETLPPRVEGVIEERIGRLEEDLRDILAVASVEGEAFTAQVVARVQEIGERRLLRELSQELERRHRLVREEGQLDVGRRRLYRFRFAHALFQAYLYNNLGTAERELLHREVAGVLVELFQGHVDQVAVQLAHHYDAAGETEKAIEYLVRAGEQARLAYANEEAMRHYQRALTLLGSRPAPPLHDEGDAWRLRALRGLGQVYAGTGRPAEAETCLREAVTLGKVIGLAPRELVRLYFWLGEVVVWQGRDDELMRIGEEGLALLEDDAESVEAALMNIAIAGGHWSKGDWKRARELTYRTAGFMQRLSYSRELQPAYDFVVLWHLLDKDVAGAMRWLQRFEERAAAHGDLNGLGRAHYWTGGALGLRGDLDGALSHYRQAVELHARIGDTRWEGSLQLPLADRCLSLGQLQQAEAYVRRGLAMIETAEHTHEQPWAHWLIGQIALCQRDWDTALDALRRAVQLGREFGDAKEPWILHTLGRVHLAQGHRAQALARFEEALASPRAKGWPMRSPAALSGIEQAYDNPDVFRAFCRRFRKAQPHSSFLPLVQWFLEPAAVRAVRTGPVPFVPGPKGQGRPVQGEPPLRRDEFVEHLPSEWVWEDPFGDCSFRVQDGLEIHAANERDLWFANLSAPRVLRLAPRETGWAAQTVCNPVSDPAAGGRPTNSGRPAIGGLVLWKDGQNYLRLDRGTAGEREISFRGCLGNEDVIIGRGRLESASRQGSEPLSRVYLRLERVGERVDALCSADGENWLTVGQVAFPVEDPIQVGMHAIGYIDRTVYHGSYPDGTAIRFESFQLWAM